MRDIIILGPGKSGTTYIGSRISKSKVLHDIGNSRFRLIKFIRQFTFFSRLILFKNLIILPFRPDDARRKSVFWNDFETAISNYKRLGPNYKLTRYETADVFLKACFEHFPYETYDEWFHRNHLWILMKPTDEKRKKCKFFRSEVVIWPLEEIDELLLDLSGSIDVVSDKPKYNKKDEFWHRILHKYVEGECIEGE